MKKMVSKTGKWLGYVLYVVVLTGGLLYLRFPSDAVRNYLISKANGLDPPMVLSLRSVRPSFPPGLDLADVDLSLRDGSGQEVLRAESLSIAPALWSFLSGAPRYRFKAHAYNGDIKGHVCLERHEADAPLTAVVRLKGIQMGLHPWLRPLLGRDVTGVVKGDIHYMGRPRRFPDGTGEGTLLVSNGSVRLLRPILGLESIDFDRLSMKMTLEDRRLSLNRVAVEGPTLKGKLSGTITLSADMPRSRLDLKGTLEPLGGLVEKMQGNAAALSFLRQGLKKLQRSFVIQGSFKSPTFRFG